MSGCKLKKLDKVVFAVLYRYTRQLFRVGASLYIDNFVYA